MAEVVSNICEVIHGNTELLSFYYYYYYYYCLLRSNKKGIFFLLFYVFFDVESESEVRFFARPYFLFTSTL